MSIQCYLLGDSVMEISAYGKLTKTDYRYFMPELERLVRASPGRVRLLVQLNQFKGWSPAALWEDLKFDFKHYHDISRLAVVGEGRMQRWMTELAKPFTTAEVRYFDQEQLLRARGWILENVEERSAVAL